MNEILNPNQIQKSTVKIVCKEDQGTGFFISSNLLITALHVITDYDEEKDNINIHFGNGTILKGKVLDKDGELDICIITIPEKHNSFLPLISSTIKVNEKWESYGFPHKGESVDLRFYGRIHQTGISTRSDIKLNCESINGNYDYEGLSGSPVVSNGKVIGIILEQDTDNLIAISIEKSKSFFEKNNLNVEEEFNYLEIPDEFNEEIKTSTLNYNVFEKIEEFIYNEGNWFLMEGSPGSGKTINAASFTPTKEEISISGKYFIKVPNDKIPKNLKTSQKYFLQWIEDIVSTTLTGSTLPVEDKTYEEKLARLPNLFGNLGEYYKNKNQYGLLIIDGLDEVQNIDEFLGIIPLSLPNNIKILLSCTTVEILPTEIKTLVGENNKLKVTPIDFGQCEKFILKEIGEEKLSIEKIQELAIKSEGHPLYLRYIVNYIKTQEFDEKENKIEDWISSIPTIGGNIKKYYDSIWDKIYSISDKLWITIILSQLRQPIPKEDLLQMLPIEYQLNFYSHYQTLQYLFKGNDRIELYHNSFKDYIKIKTSGHIDKANDYISAFNETNFDHFYSINNLLFHYSYGSNPEKSIKYCNQEWADNCSANHVPPDLIIADIKSTINISISLGKTVDLIKLILLLQRIEFRYDSIFAENANYIAQALISLKKFDAALNYLVRDNTLLVDNLDALMFLQQLYEYEANDEAEILLNAINRRFRRLLDEGLRSKEGISSQIFFLKLNAATLSMNNEFKEGLSEYMFLSQKLWKLQDAAKKDKNGKMYDAFYSIREHCAAWNAAYVLRRFDIFYNSEDRSKETHIKIDEKWANINALSILNYNELNSYNTGVFEKNTKYFALIEDLEYLIRKYGYQDNRTEIQTLISALIEDSKQCDIVSELINKFLKDTSDIKPRKPNGVDLNYPDIHNLYFEYKCKGYIDSLDNLPKIISPSYIYPQWEDYLLSLLKALSFIEGKSFYLRTQGDKEQLEIAINKYNEIIKCIDFTFNNRSYWDRSYQIPESILPILWSKIFKYIGVFSENLLDNNIDSIINYSKDQLGLYSEGYRNSLYEIIKELVKYGYAPDKINKLIEIWKDHVIKGVKNRWERTPELLKIVEIYGLIDYNEKANDVFNEMLKTSMGPSWYKEAQLDLINTTLDLKIEEKSINKYIKEFAFLLDYASGEMTFQRYVRYEKEQFVGSLCKKGNISHAIEYFKQEVLPYPEQLIINAESDTFDSPRLGDGYILGARNITEQSAILELLDKAKTCSPFPKWALAEIFIINDDIFRYINRFALLQANLLNYFEEKDHPFLSELLKTVAELAGLKAMKDDQNEYLSILKNNLTETNKLCLQGYLLEKNIPWEIETKIEKQENISDKNIPDRFDKFNSKCVQLKETDSHKLIKEGIDAFQIERINIWESNYSSKTNLARNNLKSIFKSDFEVISNLKMHINKFGSEPWHIVGELIWFLNDKLSLEQTANLYKSILEHFILLIQPIEQDSDKYKWIESCVENENPDEEIIKLIIWLLNHPNDMISKRSYKVLLDLSKYDPDVVIPLLIDECSKEDSLASPEKCSYILTEISIEKADSIINILKSDSGRKEKLKNLRHFTIKKNIFDLSINLNKQNFNCLYKSLNESIPNTVILVGSVALEEDYLEPIENEIYLLDDLGILNREFCETLLLKIKEFCKPLSIKDYIKSDGYLNRSFKDNNYNEGRFYSILKNSLNIAITPRVDKSNWKQVFEIIN